MVNTVRSLAIPWRRRYRVRILLAVLAVSLSAWFAPAESDTLSLSAAINKAGRQRMLTQRMVKAYCAVGLDVRQAHARNEMRDAMSLFESQLAELQESAFGGDVAKALDAVESQWQAMKPALMRPPGRSDALQLYEQGNTLLNSSDAVVQLLEGMSDTRYGFMVNISGRQRMLSQRLAMLYMLHAWGFNEGPIHDEYEIAQNEFEHALAILKSAPENDARSLRDLARVQEQWGWLKATLTVEQGTFFPLIVEDASEKVLLLMERLTDQYQEMAVARGLEHAEN